MLPWRLPELCRSKAALFRVSITAFFIFLFFSPDYPMAGNSSFLPRCICWWRRTCGLWHLWRQLSPGPSFTAPAKQTRGAVFFFFLGGGTPEHRPSLGSSAGGLGGGWRCWALCACLSQLSLFCLPLQYLVQPHLHIWKTLPASPPPSPAPRRLGSADPWAFPAERWLPSPAKRALGLGGEPSSVCRSLPEGAVGWSGGGQDIRGLWV